MANYNTAAHPSPFEMQEVPKTARNLEVEDFQAFADEEQPRFSQT